MVASMDTPPVRTVRVFDPLDIIPRNDPSPPPGNERVNCIRIEFQLHEEHLEEHIGSSPTEEHQGNQRPNPFLLPREDPPHHQAEKQHSTYDESNSNDRGIRAYQSSIGHRRRVPHGPKQEIEADPRERRCDQGLHLTNIRNRLSLICAGTYAPVFSSTISCGEASRWPAGLTRMKRARSRSCFRFHAPRYPMPD